jgi:hypothetical protein
MNIRLARGRLDQKNYMIPFETHANAFMKMAQPFWYENRIRGFHQGGM